MTDPVLIKKQTTTKKNTLLERLHAPNPCPASFGRITAGSERCKTDSSRNSSPWNERL